MSTTVDIGRDETAPNTPRITPRRRLHIGHRHIAMHDGAHVAASRNKHGHAPVQASVHEVPRPARHPEAQDVRLDVLPHQFHTRDGHQDIGEEPRLGVIERQAVAVVFQSVERTRRDDARLPEPAPEELLDRRARPTKAAEPHSADPTGAPRAFEKHTETLSKSRA